MNSGSVILNAASIHNLYAPDLKETSVFDCDIAETEDHLPASDCESRIPTDRKEWIGVLNTFAALTYAPATEESRMSGAGAGTSDND